MTDDKFATIVRNLPLTTGQAAIAAEVLTAPDEQNACDELIRREVLTGYQAKLILAGRAGELTVGRYVILEEIGGGGMGQVFKGRDTAMDRVVAIKLIRADRLASESAILRFQQEVKAAARLAHPNIVRAYDAGTAGERHFLVSELVTGYDLGRELARRGALPAGEACAYARQAAIGLQHAYEQGLTHRDIKPSNLLFSTNEGVVKIADFGLARLADAGVGGLTVEGCVFGTPDYISPEQACSATSADIRSDLYSLGCTLYHFLTGHVPFPADSALAKLLAHASREPDSLDDSCPGLNPVLFEVVRKLMAKSPSDRYQTPLGAADALAPFCPQQRKRTINLPSTVSGDNTPAPDAGAASTVTAPARAKTPANPAPQAPPEPPAPLPESKIKRNWKVAFAIGCSVQLFGLLVIGLVVTLSISSMGTNANSTFSFVGTSIKQPNASPVTPSEKGGNVPVNVTVNITDWPRAKEPGVLVYLDEKVVTFDDFAKRFSLPPGKYVFVAKKDGNALEARAFDVTRESADTTIKTHPVPLHAPSGPNDAH